MLSPNITEFLIKKQKSSLIREKIIYKQKILPEEFVFKNYWKKKRVYSIIAFMKKTLFLYTVLILIISYFTYFRGYSSPSMLIFDEHYYITGANKFLKGIMYFQSHPPLGKMIIALGEYILKPNKDRQWFEFNLKIVTDLEKEISDKKKMDFLKRVIGREFLRDELTEALKEENFTEEEIAIVFKEAKKLKITYVLVEDNVVRLPSGYSLAGFRFVPVLLAVLSGVIFFYILFYISKNPHMSFLFPFFYLFDNALIAHSRSAMLDGSQIFFILLSLLFFIYTLQKGGEIRLRDYFITGLFISAGLSVKISSAILFLLFIFLFIEDFLKTPLKSYTSFIKNLLLKAMIFTAGSLLVFFIIFYIHCAGGKEVLHNKFYSASDTYKKIIDHGQTANPKYFPLMLKEQWCHMMNDLRGVPMPDFDNPKEIASPPLYWPLGKKGIIYCEDRHENMAKIICLQGNPVVWYTGLISIFAAFGVIITGIVRRKSVKNGRLFRFIIYFFTLYISYMAVMFQLKRAMYLYYYLIPLIFSFVLGFLVFNYIFEEYLKKNSRGVYIITGVICLAIVISYLYYSPLTYAFPILRHEVKKMIWAGFRI